MHALRLLSALLAAMTVLFVFLFLRELLPSTPWAWTVGRPGGRLPADVRLHLQRRDQRHRAVRCLGRDLLPVRARLPAGLTPRRGVAIGALAAVGTALEDNMLGLAPGIAVRAPGARDRREPRPAPRGDPRRAGGARGGRRPARDLHGCSTQRSGTAASSSAAGGVPAADRDPGPEPGHGARRVGEAPRRRAQLHVAVLPAAASLHAPVLPELSSCATSGSTASSASSAGSTSASRSGSTTWRWRSPSGRWRSAARELISLRPACSGAARGSWPPTWRWSLGLLVLIAGTGYIARLGGAAGYEQPRYLFPLLALYGALIALAARGAGTALRARGRRPARLHRDRPHRGRDAAHPDPLLRLRGGASAADSARLELLAR